MQTDDEKGPKQCATPQTTKQPSAAEDSPASDSSLASAKISGRGMSVRRRIGLKIEAEAGEGQSDRDCRNRNEGERAQKQPGAAGKGEPSEEWWKVEYRAPPPGHLGAHAIARDDEPKSPNSRPHSVEATDQKLEKMEVAAAKSHVHETPERAKKVRGGSYLYDAATSHSSPNPKRKIMDLQDLEAGTFPSMGVAKEPKRFHETNQEIHVEGESELARSLRSASVTPSKLLRSMKKIDIQAGSSLAAQPPPAKQMANAKAPESA